MSHSLLKVVLKVLRALCVGPGVNEEPPGTLYVPSVGYAARLISMDGRAGVAILLTVMQCSERSMTSSVDDNRNGRYRTTNLGQWM